MNCNLKPFIIVLIVLIIIALSFINHEYFTSSSAGSDVEPLITTQVCNKIKSVDLTEHVKNNNIPNNNYNSWPADPIFNSDTQYHIVKNIKSSI